MPSQSPEGPDSVPLLYLHTSTHTVLPVLLFPGDGANDVSMIQVADVGVGISGQEGMQVKTSRAVLEVSVALSGWLVSHHAVKLPWPYSGSMSHSQGFAFNITNPCVLLCQGKKVR